MRRDLIIGLVISILVHGGVVIVGEITAHGPAQAVHKEETATVQLIEMPRIEPDEPEVQEETKQTLTNYAPPVQNDVPQISTDTSFTQQLEPPPPDTSQMKGGQIVIPEGQAGWAKGIEIFDISKLDQVPIPTIRANPQYPFEMRRAGISGNVLVDFIVDTNGNVHNAFAASSTQRDFESSAVQAVSKWRFRPGRKGGRAVNTHMQVPIIFTLNNED